MADEIDKSNDMILLNTELSIRQARSARPEATSTGFCLDECCGEALPEGHRWCDADCRSAWEREVRRQKLARNTDFY
jgi:hypothetical protein